MIDSPGITSVAAISSDNVELLHYLLSGARLGSNSQIFS